MFDLNNQFSHFVVVKAMPHLANSGFINHVLAIKFLNSLSEPEKFGVWSKPLNRLLTEKEIISNKEGV